MYSYIEHSSQVSENLLDEIMTWISSKRRAMNILSLPYASTDVLIPIINAEINANKKVLYITATDKGYMNLVRGVNREKIRDYCVYVGRDNDISKNAKLLITNYKNAMILEQTFDLVIYDDAVEYSTYNKYEIMDILAKYYKYDSRIISRSVETILKNAQCIEIAFRERRTPINEPRIVSTRLDLAKEIPYIMYEYIQWSIMRQRNLIILTSSKHKNSMVYECMLQINRDLHVNVIKIDGKSDLRALSSVVKLKGAILITNSIKLLELEQDNIDFIVYDSENRFFDYKKLMYICVKASKNPNKENGETVFLSKNISKDMEECKNMIRNFNKMAWETGLVNI